jgi:Rap1a immunity proteins
MRVVLGLLLVIAAGATSPESAPPKGPLTAKAKVALGLLAVDLSLEGEHGFYSGEALLRDLKLGQRLAQRKPMSQEEVFRAFRAQGYLQGLLDGLVDGVNGESAQRQLNPESAERQLNGKAHPVLCILDKLKDTGQVVAAVVEDLQRLPKDVRQQSAHMAVADTLLSEENRFIVPCSP